MDELVQSLSSVSTTPTSSTIIIKSVLQNIHLLKLIGHYTRYINYKITGDCTRKHNSGNGDDDDQDFEYWSELSLHNLLSNSITLFLDKLSQIHQKRENNREEGKEVEAEQEEELISTKTLQEFLKKVPSYRQFLKLKRLEPKPFIKCSQQNVKLVDIYCAAVTTTNGNPYPFIDCRLVEELYKMGFKSSRLAEYILIQGRRASSLVPLIDDEKERDIVNRILQKYSQYDPNNFHAPLEWSLPLPPSSLTIIDCLISRDRFGRDRKCIQILLNHTLFKSMSASPEQKIVLLENIYGLGYISVLLELIKVSRINKQIQQQIYNIDYQTLLFSLSKPSLWVNDRLSIGIGIRISQAIERKDTEVISFYLKKVPNLEFINIDRFTLNYCKGIIHYAKLFLNNIANNNNNNNNNSNNYFLTEEMREFIISIDWIHLLRLAIQNNYLEIVIWVTERKGNLISIWNQYKKRIKEPNNNNRKNFTFFGYVGSRRPVDLDLIKETILSIDHIECYQYCLEQDFIVKHHEVDDNDQSAWTSKKPIDEYIFLKNIWLGQPSKNTKLQLYGNNNCYPLALAYYYGDLAFIRYLEKRKPTTTGHHSEYKKIYDINPHFIMSAIDNLLLIYRPSFFGVLQLLLLNYKMHFTLYVVKHLLEQLSSKEKYIPFKIMNLLVDEFCMKDSKCPPNQEVNTLQIQLHVTMYCLKNGYHQLFDKIECYDKTLLNLILYRMTKDKQYYVNTMEDSEYCDYIGRVYPDLTDLIDKQFIQYLQDDPILYRSFLLKDKLVVRRNKYHEYLD